MIWKEKKKLEFSLLWFDKIFIVYDDTWCVLWKWGQNITLFDRNK